MIACIALTCAEQEHVFGIDFGTESVVVAEKDDKLPPMIVEDEFGQRQRPCIIALDEDLQSPEKNRKKMKELSRIPKLVTERQCCKREVLSVVEGMANLLSNQLNVRSPTFHTKWSGGAIAVPDYFTQSDLMVVDDAFSVLGLGNQTQFVRTNEAASAWYASESHRTMRQIRQSQRGSSTKRVLFVDVGDSHTTFSLVAFSMGCGQLSAGVQAKGREGREGRVCVRVLLSRATGILSGSSLTHTIWGQLLSQYHSLAAAARGLKKTEQQRNCGDCVSDADFSFSPAEQQKECLSHPDSCFSADLDALCRRKEGKGKGKRWKEEEEVNKGSYWSVCEELLQSKGLLSALREAAVWHKKTLAMLPDAAAAAVFESPLGELPDGVLVTSIGTLKEEERERKRKERFVEWGEGVVEEMKRILAEEKEKEEIKEEEEEEEEVDVEVIGGGIRFPLAKELVNEVFANERHKMRHSSSSSYSFSYSPSFSAHLSYHLNADESVALGAAVIAAGKQMKTKAESEFFGGAGKTRADCGAFHPFEIAGAGSSGGIIRMCPIVGETIRATILVCTGTQDDPKVVCSFEEAVAEETQPLSQIVQLNVPLTSFCAGRAPPFAGTSHPLRTFAAPHRSRPSSSHPPLPLSYSFSPSPLPGRRQREAAGEEDEGALRVTLALHSAGWISKVYAIPLSAAVLPAENGKGVFLTAKLGFNSHRIMELFEAAVSVGVSKSQKENQEKYLKRGGKKNVNEEEGVSVGFGEGNEKEKEEEEKEEEEWCLDDEDNMNEEAEREREKIRRRISGVFPQNKQKSSRRRHFEREKEKMKMKMKNQFNQKKMKEMKEKEKKDNKNEEDLFVLFERVKFEHLERPSKEVLKMLNATLVERRKGEREEEEEEEEEEEREEEEEEREEEEINEREGERRLYYSAPLSVSEVEEVRVKMRQKMRKKAEKAKKAELLHFVEREAIECEKMMAPAGFDGEDTKKRGKEGKEGKEGEKKKLEGKRGWDEEDEVFVRDSMEFVMSCTEEMKKEEKTKKCSEGKLVEVLNYLRELRIELEAKQRN
ncbi:uncharacterized protein MONOS_9620 [Monocercomonoides exilis]|uniref:uncharacterized protein n=1 Tax=Monocercomonoides exilis TaxID=2049356 RepID=UPI00355A4F75|nr:hypothetical protein MONOS_9620 [Monocercomonoides exilis]